MVKLLKTSIRLSGTLFAAALLASAQGQGTVARPGMINYAEGQVAVNGQSIGQKEIGHFEVAPGQTLETKDGKAEMLLTPGVFLRLSDNTAVRMVNPSLTDTRVELVGGEAMVEADQVLKGNHLDVMDSGANTLIQKKGLYEFRANQPAVAVYDGKVQVQQDDRTTEVGKHHEVLLGANNPKLKSEKFDAKQAEMDDPLYNWSSLRSEYVAEANANMAQTIVVNNPGWWYGDGWYWDPWFDSWAFMPGAGFMYSPFGFGFYSPAYWAYAGPYFGYGYRGFYGRGYRGVAGRGFAGRAPVAGRGAFAGRGAIAPRMSVGGFGGAHAMGPMGGGHFGGGHFGGHFGGGRR